MPEKINATPPAAPAAPVTPSPAAPAAPTAPKAAPARQSTLPTREAPKKLSARKALGLEDSVSKMVGQEIRKTRDRIRQTTPVTAELTTPEPPKPVKAAAAPPVTEPTAPAAPVAGNEPAPAPAAPALEPAKVKIGDREYTVQELEAKLKETPGPAPAPAPEPTPEAPKQLTAEEIKAAEDKFLQDTASGLEVPLTEEQMDTILAGGKDAVSTLQQIRRTDMATAVLSARKGIAAALDPIMNQLFAAVKPLVQQHQDLQRYTVKQQFMAKHTGFTPHIARAEAIAEELARLYPQQVAKMTTDQFIDEVARQTDRILTDEHRRWFPQGNGNWRAAAAPAPAAALAAPASAAPVVPAPAPAPLRAPAPVANPPTGAGMATAPGWHKSVANSMR